MDAFYALVLQEAPKGEEKVDQAPAWTFWVPLVLMFVIIYFMMIRPSGKQRREREQMLKGVQKNDHIMTSGGIYGVVTKVTDNDVILRVDDKSDVRIRISRAAIAGIEKTSGKEGDSSKVEEKANS